MLAIKNSIEEFGFADPLVVNADMTIIGGHQRLTIAMALGYTEVPCAVVDIDKVSFTTESNTLTVANEPGVALPSTGGIGTNLFYILGSILILGAGVLLWGRRRLI